MKAQANEQQEYLRQQDNLVAAIFSHHRLVLEKIKRQENPSEEDKRVYELKKFLDKDHSEQLKNLLANIILTRLESSLTQPEILENFISYLREEINLTGLLAKLGQRNLQSAIEMLNESSQQALGDFVKKRFDKRHFYTLSKLTAKKRLAANATGALTIGGALSLLTGSTLFFAPIALATLVFAGFGQVKHNFTTMIRCLLIAKELHIDLLEEEKEEIALPTAEINSAAQKDLSMQLVNPFSTEAPKLNRTGIGAWSTSFNQFFWARTKKVNDSTTEIDKDIELQTFNANP